MSRCIHLNHVRTGMVYVTAKNDKTPETWCTTPWKITINWKDNQKWKMKTWTMLQNTVSFGNFHWSWRLFLLPNGHIYYSLWSALQQAQCKLVWERHHSYENQHIFILWKSFINSIAYVSLSENISFSIYLGWRSKTRWPQATLFMRFAQKETDIAKQRSSPITERILMIWLEN